MTLTPLCKGLLAYGLITLLALGLLWWHLGGILPGLLLMGVVMGIQHLACLLWFQEDDDDEPCDPRL